MNKKGSWKNIMETSHVKLALKQRFLVNSMTNLLWKYNIVNRLDPALETAALEHPLSQTLCPNDTVYLGLPPHPSVPVPVPVPVPTISIS